MITVRFKWMCNKAVDSCLFLFNCVPDCYKIQEMCEKIVSSELYMLKYSLNRYKAQEKFEKVVVPYLSALKFVSDWFLTPKILEILRIL